MNRQRGLWAGIFILAILGGCSKDKTLNVEGSYSPVIVNIASSVEPPVRGDVNALTVIVQNPRGYPLVYHWSAGAGVLTDSTAATAHWTPPDSIGTYPVTVSIQAHDDLNNVDFFKTRTFQVRVDNEFHRWTRSIAIQFDVEPPTAGKMYYSELRNTSTGESDIWALGTALGMPEQITHGFWQATSPTVQSDGSRVAFLGRKDIVEARPSLWQVPPSGGDTATASLLLRYNQAATVQYISAPRFAPSGSMVAYSVDTIPSNFFFPKPWMRDAANLNVPPVPILPSTTGAAGTSVEQGNIYWNPAWSGTGDSIVTESLVAFKSPSQSSRGFFKFSTAFTPPGAPNNPEPFSPWLVDVRGEEPDWSPDGQHIVYARRLPGRTDRDIFIINAHASDPSSAVPVTTGPSDDFHPRFTSDGSTIFFVSNRADNYGANGFYDTERRGTNIWSVSRFDLP
jgi:hypothetical protein